VSPERRGADPRAEEPVEELAAEAARDNPDETTRRETFELSLMEQGRADEDREVTVEEQGPAGGER
jgi:hypothetical protein